LAGSIKSLTLTEQSVGRILRATEPYVFDIVHDHRILKTHFNERQKWYKSRNATIKIHRLVPEVTPYYDFGLSIPELAINSVSNNYQSNNNINSDSTNINGNRTDSNNKPIDLQYTDSSNNFINSVTLTSSSSMSSNNSNQYSGHTGNNLNQYRQNYIDSNASIEYNVKEIFDIDESDDDSIPDFVY
jgi:hypothetical protein